MKFAKRMESEAVAEWRPKYLQYKQLKKLIKIIVSESGPAVIINSSNDVEKGPNGLSSNEVLFFEKFEAELAKIDEFYQAREKEAVDKKFKIMAQLHILPEDDSITFRKKIKKRGGGGRGGGDITSSPVKENNTANLLTWRSLQSPETLRELSGGSGDEGLTFTFNNNNNQLSLKSGQSPSSEMPEHLKISSLRPASFTHLARLRIKKALLEYYRLLELLRNFKTLNVLGCAKILKKFDKNTGRSFAPKYMEKLRAQSIYRSQVVDSLMTDVENIYRWVFTEGDRTKALRKLRVKDLKRETFHGAALTCGVLLGICLALIWRLVTLVINSNNPVRQMLGVIYFTFGLPFMMAWLFAVNAEVWERYYVNYRFIFEFNQRNNLHTCQYSALVGIFSITYLIMVMLSLEGWLDFIIPTMLQPWLVIASTALILIWPSNHMYRQSRIWFARVILRIFTAPFYPCRFKDFFINDQYMSLTATFEYFGVLIFYTLAGKEPKDLTVPAVWYIYLLQLLPGLWRSLQCLRRYHDSKMAFPHLANLAKYACSLSIPVILGIQRIYDIKSFFYVLIVARAISSTFSLGWDIVMDFGLWQRSAVNDRLRNTILFKPWIYWYLIISDFIARYLWILPLVRPSIFPTIPAISLSLVLWTVEALRRFQWNFFRVEYEHVNNCNVLRAVADVPLPFTATDLFYQDMVETMEAQRNLSPVTSCLDSPQLHHHLGEVASPASSVAGDDLDEEEYGESLSYEHQLEMVQKSAAATAETAVHHRSTIVVDPRTIGSGWSSPTVTRPTVSTMFTTTPESSSFNSSSKKAT